MKETVEEQHIQKHKILEAYLNCVRFKEIGSGKLLAGYLESNSYHVFKLSFIESVKNIIKLIGPLLGMLQFKYIKTHNSEYIFTRINSKFHFGALIDPLILHYLANSTVYYNENSFNEITKAAFPIKGHSINKSQAYSNSWKDIGMILLTILKVLIILTRNKKRLDISYHEIIIFLKGLILQIRGVSFWNNYFENTALLPKCIVTELDRTSMPSPLILTAKKYSIFTITLTHGVIGEYGFTPLFADHIFCWGKFQKSQLISQGVESRRISITGNPMFESFKVMAEDQNKIVYDSTKVCLAICPGVDEMNRLLIDLFIQAIYRSEGITGIIKLHPTLGRNSFKWVNLISPNIIILESSDITNTDLFASIDLLLVRYSGIANEALAAGIPVAIVNPENISYLNVLQAELIQNAGCELATNVEELTEIFKKMVATPVQYKTNAVERSKNYLMNLYEFTGEDSVNAMIAEIDRLTERL